MKENCIKNYYDGLPNGEKGKFMVWLQLKMEISQTTAQLRLKDGGWRAIEEKAIMEGIKEESWRHEFA